MSHSLILFCFLVQNPVLKQCTLTLDTSFFTQICVVSLLVVIIRILFRLDHCIKHLKITIYSLEYHNSCLSNMCRICGQRAQTFAQIRKKNSPVLCKNNQDEIYIFYGIDVANENLFPMKMCSMCYITMKHAKVKSESPKMDTSIFKGKKKMADKVTKIFQPHRRIGCKVCQIYNEQKKPGRKTATKTGRPCQKEQNTWDNEAVNIFPTYSVTHQFIMYQILKFMGSLKHRKKHSFVKFVWIFSQNNQLEPSAIITFVHSVSHKLFNANKQIILCVQSVKALFILLTLKLQKRDFSNNSHTLMYSVLSAKRLALCVLSHSIFAKVICHMNF